MTPSASALPCEVTALPCDHRWLRFPVVDLSVFYQCRDCETSVVLGWRWLAWVDGKTMGDMDRALKERYGGTVTGTC